MGRIVWFTPPLLAAGAGASATPVLVVGAAVVAVVGIGAYFLGKSDSKG